MPKSLPRHQLGDLGNLDDLAEGSEHKKPNHQDIKDNAPEKMFWTLKIQSGDTIQFH